MASLITFFFSPLYVNINFNVNVNVNVNYFYTEWYFTTSRSSKQLDRCPKAGGFEQEIGVLYTDMKCPEKNFLCTLNSFWWRYHCQLYNCLSCSQSLPEGKVVYSECCTLPFPRKTTDAFKEWWSKVNSVVLWTDASTNERLVVRYDIFLWWICMFFYIKIP